MKIQVSLSFLIAPINAKQAIALIDDVTHLKDKEQINCRIGQLSALLQTNDHTLSLQEKAKVEKKVTEVEEIYRKTHSTLKRIVNAILTKLHIRTDFYAIDALHKIDDHHKRLLTDAIQAGDAQVISELLQLGLDPNSQTHYESLPAIHLAAEVGQIEIMKLLLDAKADINIRDNFRDNETRAKTPLIRMSQFPSTPQNLAVIQYLVDRGADLNMKAIDVTGWHCTALYMMTVMNNIEGMEILLKRGVNPNIIARYQPLQTAIYRGHIDAIKLLLKYKADPNIKNNQGQTPLYSCLIPKPDAAFEEAWNGKLEALRLLLAAGADPNQSTDRFKRMDSLPLDSLPLDVVHYAEVRDIFFTLLQAGRPIKPPYVKTPVETRIMSDLDNRRQVFANRCLEEESSQEKKLEYKKIIYHHTHWLLQSDIEKDPDYMRMYLEDTTKRLAPQPSVVDKSDLRKDCLIKVRTKNNFETKIYAANRVLLDQESDFFAAYNLAKDAENLYEHIPERITPEEFEKVLRHIEGIEEFDRKKDKQKNFDFFGLKPFKKSIKNFASMWDLSTELPYRDRPKEHLSDMKLTCRDKKTIPVHKTVLEALSQDKKISPLLEGIIQEDSQTVNNFLHVLYTEDTSQVWSEEEVVAVAKLCNQFGINKKQMTGLGTRYFELALPRLLNDLGTLISLSEEEKILMKNLPVGHLDLDPYPEITPTQFTDLIDLMPHDFLPEIKFSNCTHLSTKEVEFFQNAFVIQ